jgi:VanZ family protein
MDGALGRFGPPLVWMAAIAFFSGDSLAAEETASWVLPVLAALLPWASPPTLHALHAALRKLGHVVEYGILATLWLRALGPGRPTRRAALWAIGLAAAYAVADEARQSLTGSRSPSAVDVALDAASAFLAVAWLEAPGGLAAAGITALRGAAAVVTLASLAMALVDWSLGLAVWDLVLAALGSMTLGWLLGGLARRWRAASRGPDN